MIEYVYYVLFFFARVWMDQRNNQIQPPWRRIGFFFLRYQRQHKRILCMEPLKERADNHNRPLYVYDTIIYCVVMLLSSQGASAGNFIIYDHE